MKREETLDPEDWQELKSLAHRMVDDMLDYLQTVRDRPVWQPTTEAIRSQLQQSLPEEPEGPEKAYQDFQQYVLPYPMGNIHPRFWGWVNGTGSPFAMLAEMLAAGMNPNVGAFDQASVYVENQVLAWCKEMLSYPATASGLLVSGGSMANLVGLAVARNAKAGVDVAHVGLQTTAPRLVLYGSTETHNSVDKSVGLLGLGSTAFRKIPVNSQFQINIQELGTMLMQDRAAGLHPFCIVGNAGTVNTGAIDDLDELAAICEKENLWFHVDGAFGALAYLAPSLRGQLKGMQRADSLAFDLHKWMYVPYEAGCILIRHPGEHHSAFSTPAAYLTSFTKGPSAGPFWFGEYGVQLSRGFRALKIWMSFKAHGIGKFRRLIEQNVAQAKYLAESILSAEKLELLAPVPLNVVCFRYQVEGRSEEQLNELNQEILVRLQESGIAVPSGTTLNGRFAIRVAITNHRSRREDFDILVNKVMEIGDRL